MTLHKMGCLLLFSAVFTYFQLYSAVLYMQFSCSLEFADTAISMFITMDIGPVLGLYYCSFKEHVT